MTPLDALTCRSPSRCPTCEWWRAGGCALEAQLAVALAPKPTPRPGTLNSGLAWTPARTTATAAAKASA